MTLKSIKKGKLIEMTNYNTQKQNTKICDYCKTEDISENDLFMCDDCSKKYSEISVLAKLLQNNVNTIRETRDKDIRERACQQGLEICEEIDAPFCPVRIRTLISREVGFSLERVKDYLTKGHLHYRDENYIKNMDSDEENAIKLDEYLRQAINAVNKRINK